MGIVDPSVLQRAFPAAGPGGAPSAGAGGYPPAPAPAAPAGAAGYGYGTPPHVAQGGYGAPPAAAPSSYTRPAPGGAPASYGGPPPPPPQQPASGYGNYQRPPQGAPQPPPQQQQQAQAAPGTTPEQAAVRLLLCFLALLLVTPRRALPDSHPFTHAAHPTGPQHDGRPNRRSRRDEPQHDPADCASSFLSSSFGSASGHGARLVELRLTLSLPRSQRQQAQRAMGR